MYYRNQAGFIYFDNKTLQRRPNPAGERAFTKQNILIRMTYESVSMSHSQQGIYDVISAQR